MAETIQMKIIARIRTGFSQKFGIPRQSGLADTPGIVVFEPEYRDANALRGLGEYSHLWLIWQFSDNVRDSWSPTVRPPRLGGNRRMGVFATRSPFRPNAIGLSVVRLQKIEIGEQGPMIHVLGADLLDGTPILDIKPYLPYADSYPQASGGFTDSVPRRTLTVRFPPEPCLPDEQRLALEQVLSCDPRPSYQTDPDRVYGLCYQNLEVRFKVREDVLQIVEITAH